MDFRGLERIGVDDGVSKMRKLLRKRSIEEVLYALHERLLDESDCLSGINAVESRKKALEAQLVMNKLHALQLRASELPTPA